MNGDWRAQGTWAERVFSGLGILELPQSPAMLMFSPLRNEVVVVVVIGSLRMCSPDHLPVPESPRCL